MIGIEICVAPTALCLYFHAYPGLTPRAQSFRPSGLAPFDQCDPCSSVVRISDPRPSAKSAVRGLPTQNNHPARSGVVVDDLTLPLEMKVSLRCQSGLDLLFHQVADEPAVALDEGQLVGEGALQQAADGKVSSEVGRGHQRDVFGNAQVS